MSYADSNIPDALKNLIDDFSFITTRQERQEYLIQLSRSFSVVKVPETVATQPYDEQYRVPACESEAFVWAIDNEDGTLQYYFDVLNPQGLSAKAMAVIMGDACSGIALEQVADIPSEIVYEFFGNNIAMGKGQGLISLVNMVVYEAKRRLNT